MSELKSSEVEKVKSSKLFNLQPFNMVCQALAILALFCQPLANAGCTSYTAAMRDMGAASRAAIETTPGFDTLPEARE